MSEQKTRDGVGEKTDESTENQKKGEEERMREQKTREGRKKK